MLQGKAGLQNGSHEPARQHDGPDSAPAHANGDSPDHLPPSSHVSAALHSQHARCAPVSGCTALLACLVVLVTSL